MHAAARLAPARSGAPPGAGQSRLLRVGSLNSGGGRGSEPRHRCRRYTSARRGVGPSGGRWEVWATGRTSTWEAAARGSAWRPRGPRNRQSIGAKRFLEGVTAERSRQEDEKETRNKDGGCMQKRGWCWWRTQVGSRRTPPPMFVTPEWLALLLPSAGESI